MTKSNSLKIKPAIKAGGFGIGNHNRSLKSDGLKVKVATKAGGFGIGNHNRALCA
jgi:hypothetical protein